MELPKNFKKVKAMLNKNKAIECQTHPRLQICCSTVYNKQETEPTPSIHPLTMKMWYKYMIEYCSMKQIESCCVWHCGATGVVLLGAINPTWSTSTESSQSYWTASKVNLRETVRRMMAAIAVDFCQEENGEERLLCQLLQHLIIS